MTIVISDLFFSRQNVYGRNGEMVKLMDSFATPITILFIINIERPMLLEEYLYTVDKFTYYHWKTNFQRFEKHQIILCKKEDVMPILLHNPSSSSIIHQFCKKENLIYGVKSTLYLHPFDKLCDIQSIDSFEKIVTAIDYGSTPSNVVFQPYTIDHLSPSLSPSLSLSPTEQPKHKKNKPIVFIHLLNRDYNKLDRVVLGLQHIDAKVILYNPTYEHIPQKEKLSAFSLENDKLFYEVGDTQISFEIPQNYDTIDKETFVDFKIKTYNAEDLYSNNESYETLLKLYCKDYVIIDQYFEEERELLQQIYDSDIYIPITNEFSTLALISQKLKTYTLFLTDEEVYKYYCVYGKVVGATHSDVCYNILDKRIEKVVKSQDIKAAIEEYIENENNPMFQYTKEIAHALY
jgi:hypothetical protein